MKASDLFVQCLENAGVTHIFGVPGEENADFVMSLEKSNAITFILTRHEQGAAFMAEVYGRLTGKPAGCLATLGPGATNLLTGVADANMDRAPLLALTGQGSTARLHKESHQIMNVVDMFRPVTKWASSVNNPDAIPEIVNKAVRLATHEKPGAVLVELPEDVAKRQTDAKPIPLQLARRPAPDDKIMDKVWRLLQHAKKPLIIAGNGAVRRRAHKQLVQFCDASQIGVLSTFMGKGAVSMDAPYCLFTIGLGQKDVVSRAVDDADLILCVGYDIVEYPPALWNPDNNKTIIHLDFLPAETDAFYNLAAEAVGDLAHALWALNERIRRDGAPSSWDFSRQRRIRERMNQEIHAHDADDSKGTITPQKALYEARKALGPDDILLSGVGAHKMWISRHYQCNQPNTCIIPNGFCSMGLPLPGAVAAHIVHPERRILGVAGDGDFLMNVQEMETASRLKSNITMMVWEDKEYGLIAWKQTNTFGKHTPLSFTNPDWLQLSQAFGWHGQYVRDADQLADALDASFKHNGPSLVVIPIDYSENAKLTQRLGEIVMQI